MRKFLLLLLMLFFTVGMCNAQLSQKRGTRKAEKALFGKSLSKKKTVKIKEPRAVVKAKKKQEAKEKKQKRDYANALQRSQKRTVEIQTPEVQARMKQNKKDSALRDKQKKKKIKSGTKKAGKKYN